MSSTDDDDLAVEDENGTDDFDSSGTAVKRSCQSGRRMSSGASICSPAVVITNAFVGTPSEPIVWVDGNGRQIERDPDGTYVIRID